METNENENKAVQNLWDAANAVLRGKSVAMQTFLKNQERSQIHNLSLPLKELEKEQPRKPKPRRRREIIKIRAEINEVETKRTVEHIKESRSSFSERINKIDTSLGRLLQKKGEKDPNQ